MKNDGGYAFPIKETPVVEAGLTKRDYFAGQALAGLCVNYLNPQEDNDEAILTLSELVKVSYNIAEEMLAEKEKRNA